MTAPPDEDVPDDDEARIERPNRPRRPTSLFLCYDTERDRQLARRFVAELAKLPIPARVMEATQPQGGRGAAGWQGEALLGQRIERCDAMVMLIGPQAALAPVFELEPPLARRSGVPVFGVYVGSAMPGQKLPKGVTPRHIVGWDPGIIAQTLRRLVPVPGKKIES